MRKTLLVAAVLAAVTVTAAAAEKVKRHSLTIFSNSDINGVQLKPGEYQVAFEDNSVVFYRGRKEVAKAPARTEQVGSKYERNAVLYLGDERTVSEIRLEGSNQKLVVEGAAARAGAAKATAGSQN